MVQQLRVVQEGQHLAHEGDGLLAECLGVAYVAEHHALERELESVAAFVAWGVWVPLAWGAVVEHSATRRNKCD